MSDVAINDQDIELLEMYLDGELSNDEAHSLRRRLSVESALAAAMDALSHERELRREALASMEATSGSLRRNLSRALEQAAVREMVWSSRMRIVRQVASLAACLIVGIGVGWFANGRTETTQPNSRIVSSNPSRPQLDPSITLAGTDQAPRRANGFNVAITDDFGRVLAQQRFDTLDQARQFTSDLTRWQTRQRQARNGEVRLIGDDF